MVDFAGKGTNGRGNDNAYCAGDLEQKKKDREVKVVIFAAILLITIAMVIFTMPPSSSTGYVQQNAGNSAQPSKGISGSQCCPLP